MVAPSFSTAGTLASANAASISPGLPAGWAVGDFWFLAVASDGGTLSLSAGWDQYALSNNTVSGQGTQTILFATRVAQSGDAAPTISGATNSVVGRVWKIVNANTADPFDGDAQFVKPTTLSADIATPAITISGEDRLVVIGVAWRDDIGTAVLNSGTPTFTSLFEIETLSGTDAGMVAYSHASTGASTIAARSVNITASGPSLAQGFAIAFNPSSYSSVTGVSVTSEPAGEVDVIITTSDDAIVRVFYDTVSRPTDTDGSLYANESAWEPISEVVEAGPFLITLTGLTEGQTYYYKVEAKNAANSSWYTAESSFRYDTAGPVISGIGTTPLARSVTITWTTDEAGSSQIKYDTTSHAGANDTYAVTRAELDTVTRVTNHSYNVTGLSPTTTYYYRVRGSDSSGNDSGWSAENSFTTLADALVPGALLLDANFRTLSVRAPFSMTGGSAAGYTAIAEYKRTTDSTWRQAPEMRVDTRATLGFAGNSANWAVNEARCKIFRVQPNITYDVRVTWSGGVIQGSATITGQTTTLPETTPTPTNRILYVAPTGNDLNNGLTFATAKATLKGAFDIAQAGDDIQIQPSAYSINTANLPVLSVDGNGSGAWGSGWIRVRKRPGQAGDVILEGNGVNNHVIQILGSYVAITDITMRIALQSVVYIGGTQKSHRWIENCTISDWGEGTTGSEQHFAGIAMWLNPERSFILNNTLTRRVILAGQQNAMGHGIWLKNQTGDGEWGGRHIIRGNTIVGGYDCIGAEAENDRHGGPRLNSDTYLNTCSGYVDDAIQMEGANINCAVFDNIINCAGGIVGIATAPSGIGPIYVMYNQINNPGSYAFKIGDQGDGFQHWYHNTVYEASSGGNAGGGPGQTNGGLSNIISRNNIFQADRYTMETTTAANSGVGIRDFDYDNLHTTDPSRFIKWWNTNYSSLAAFRTATGQELHGFSINAFNEWANPAAGDFRLKSTSSFIDAGQIIPGINSDLDDATYNYSGSAPNLGAIERILSNFIAAVSSATASSTGAFIRGVYQDALLLATLQSANAKPGTSLSTIVAPLPRISTGMTVQGNSGSTGSTNAVDATGYSTWRSVDPPATGSGAKWLAAYIQPFTTEQKQNLLVYWRNDASTPDFWGLGGTPVSRPSDYTLEGHVGGTLSTFSAGGTSLLSANTTDEGHAWVDPSYSTGEFHYDGVGRVVAETAECIAYVDYPPETAAYTVEVDMIFTTFGSDGYGGILLRALDSTPTYYWIGYDDGIWGIRKSSVGNLDTHTQTVVQGQTYNLRATISGTSTTVIDVWLNDVLILSATDSTSPYTAAGYAGLLASNESSSVVKFDNFQVTEDVSTVAPLNNWLMIGNATDNIYNSRTYGPLDASPYHWLRLNFTEAQGTDPNDDVALQLQLHDATLANDDHFLFLGDEIIGEFSRVTKSGGAGDWSGGNLADKVNALDSTRYPLIVSGGITDYSIESANTNKTELLNGFSGKYVVLMYGGQDAENDLEGLDYGAELIALQTYITGLGKTLILPHLPRRTDDPAYNSYIIAYNTRIDSRVNGTNTLAGPNFYTLVANGTIPLEDGFHPTTTGYEAMQTVMAAWIVDNLYTKETSAVITGGTDMYSGVSTVTASSPFGSFYIAGTALLAAVITQATAQSNNAPWTASNVFAAIANLSLAMSPDATILSRTPNTLGAATMLATGRSYDPTWRYPIVIPVNTVIANAGMSDATIYQPVLATMLAQTMYVTSVVSSVAGMHGRVLYAVSNALSAIATSNNGYIGEQGSIAFNAAVATALGEIPTGTFIADIAVYLGGFISFRDSSMVDTLTSLQMGYTTMKWGVAEVVDTLATFPTMHKRS